MALKQPAYARRILEARKRRQHPPNLEIAVVYGERWWEAEQPKICVKPCDYEPGRFDFRAVAGYRVTLLDQDLGVTDIDEMVTPVAFGKFYYLVGELAAADALVDIVWPAKSRLAPRDAASLAFDYMTWDRAQRKHVPPPWWPASLLDRQTRRMVEWQQDVVRMRRGLGAGCGG